MEWKDYTYDLERLYRLTHHPVVKFRHQQIVDRVAARPKVRGAGGAAHRFFSSLIGLLRPTHRLEFKRDVVRRVNQDGWLEAPVGWLEAKMGLSRDQRLRAIHVWEKLGLVETCLPLHTNKRGQVYRTLRLRLNLNVLDQLIEQENALSEAISSRLGNPTTSSLRHPDPYRERGDGGGTKMSRW